MVDIVAHRHQLRDTADPRPQAADGAGAGRGGRCRCRSRGARHSRPRTRRERRKAERRSDPRPPDQAASEGDRPLARPHPPADGGAGRSAGPLRARRPRRRHQRQRLDRCHHARHCRSGRPARARLHLAASGALQRAHPRGGKADRRRGTGADPGRGGARQCRPPDHLLRGDDGGGVPRLRPRSRPISSCSRSGWAAGSTRPTSSSGRRCARSRRSRSTICSISAIRWRRSRARRPAS